MLKNEVEPETERADELAATATLSAAAKDEDALTPCFESRLDLDDSRRWLRAFAFIVAWLPPTAAGVCADDSVAFALALALVVVVVAVVSDSLNRLCGRAAMAAVMDAKAEPAIGWLCAAAAANEAVAVGVNADEPTLPLPLPLALPLKLPLPLP